MELPFQLFSLIFTLTTFMLLINTISRRKYLLVKPSMWFIIFLHLQIQWSSVVQASEIYNRLSSPEDFFILTQFFPLLFLVLSRLTFISESKFMYQKMKLFEYPLHAIFLKRVLRLCIGLSIPILIYYLMNVPFTKTGLYEILYGNDLALAVTARENSLKLASASVRYSYVFFNKTLALAIAMILVLKIRHLITSGQRKKIAVPALILLLVVFASSFSGARSHGVYVLLVGVSVLIFVAKIKINPVKLSLGVVLLLFIPVSLQLQKFGQEFSIANVLTGYETILVKRTLSVPMQTGLNWIDYVQKYGFWGISGVSFLQEFSTESPKSVSNIMMNFYMERASVATGLMNTSFLFSYYSYFGYFAYLILVPLVLFLDSVLYVIKKFPPGLMVLATTSACLTCINLVNTEYHTIFLSYGFATGLMLYAMIWKTVSVK